MAHRTIGGPKEMEAPTSQRPQRRYPDIKVLTNPVAKIPKYLGYAILCVEPHFLG